MMKPLIVLALVLVPHDVHARDRSETCTSYQRATGTVVTDCRAPGRKQRHCESYTNITLTTRTECR
jgi:hypothetical protein